MKSKSMNTATRTAFAVGENLSVGLVPTSSFQPQE